MERGTTVMEAGKGEDSRESESLPLWAPEGGVSALAGAII